MTDEETPDSEQRSSGKPIASNASEAPVDTIPGALDTGMNTPTVSEQNSKGRWRVPGKERHAGTSKLSQGFSRRDRRGPHRVTVGTGFRGPTDTLRQE